MSYDYLFEIFFQASLWEKKWQEVRRILTPADRSQSLLPVTIMGHPAPRKPWRFETVSNASQTPVW